MFSEIMHVEYDIFEEYNTEAFYSFVILEIFTEIISRFMLDV